MFGCAWVNMCMDTQGLLVALLLIFLAVCVRDICDIVGVFGVFVACI